jgi:hypothetical protein
MFGGVCALTEGSSEQVPAATRHQQKEIERTSRTSKTKFKLSALSLQKTNAQVELRHNVPNAPGRSKAAQLVPINSRHDAFTLIRVTSMNRNIFYIIGVIVVIIIVLKLLGVF